VQKRKNSETLNTTLYINDTKWATNQRFFMKANFLLLLFPMLVSCTMVITAPTIETTPTANNGTNDTTFTEQAPTDIDTQTYTGISEVDSVVQTLLTGEQDAIRRLIQFTEIDCTKMEGLGGPPRCETEEVEGTPILVFPILAQSGYYIRPNEINKIKLSFTELYAVYQTTGKTSISEDGRPTGEYGLIFIEQDSIASSSTVFLINGKISGLVANLSKTPAEALERAKGKIVYKSKQE